MTIQGVQLCWLLVLAFFVSSIFADNSDNAEYNHKLAMLEQYAQSSVLQQCCNITPEEESEDLLECSLDTLAIIRSLFHSGHKDWPPRFSVVSYATTNIHDYAGYSLSLNAAYCSTHGYSFQVLSPTEGAEYEPADQRWNKVRILLEALDGGSNSSQSEWVLWLDADLAVIEPTLDLEALVDLAPNVDIFVCSDPEPAEIFSLVNTGALLVRNTPWTRDFLRRWWGDAASRKASWDQHAFTRLYLGQDMAVASDSDLAGSDGTQDWSAVAVQSHIHILPADALNTRRPATLHHHKDCPVLHMVGALNAHRALVFKEAWRNACDYSSSVLLKSLVTPTLKGQLGLTKERLVQIESKLLGGRYEWAEELVNLLTQLPGSALPDANQMSSFRKKLRTIMKLGDPRVGDAKDTSMVAQAMKHYYKLLKRQLAAIEQGPDSAAMELELLHETVDVAFELALPPSKPFYQRQLMSDIAPLVQRIGQLSLSKTGKIDSHAAYFDFKRLQFVSKSYSINGGPPDSGADRLKQQDALEQALEAWEQIVVSDEAAVSAERGSGQGSLLEEGAEILDTLAVLRCMEKRNMEGLVMAQRGATLLEQYWGLQEALLAIRGGLVDSSPVGLELVPPATLVSMATTYRNMAVCASENKDNSAALQYYLNAALLRTDLLLVHGKAQNSKNSAIEYDDSPSSQRAQQQHSLEQQVKEESEQELTELVYRISALAGRDRSSGIAALESRLRVLRGPKEQSVLLTKASKEEKVAKPVQAVEPTQAETAMKPDMATPVTETQPKKKKMMKKKKKKVSNADEL